MNGRKFPNKYIAYGNYKSTPDQKTDKDSYTDADGKLHRNILPHTATKIEITTPVLHLKDKMELQSYFPNTVEMDIEYWNDRTNEYESATVYVPDISFEYHTVFEEARDILYKPIRIALIEY